MRKNVWNRIVFFVLGLSLLFFGSVMRGAISEAAWKEGSKAEREAESSGPYVEDDRLEFVEYKKYTYDSKEAPAVNYLCDQYTWIAEPYSEEEMAEFDHAVFDEKNRMRYMLGYTAGILGESSYCEEQVFEWDDVNHTCRHIYYKANSSLCDQGFYVPYRYMFDVCYYQFGEDGRLLSRLDYSRDVGSDQFGYSEELFYNRGYQAAYDEDRLTEELVCYNYWGTNEVGSWEHRLYQYDEQGKCILSVVTTEDDIQVFCYEYDAAAEKVGVYTYRVREKWELECEDGSIIYFQSVWNNPALKKVDAEGKVERELRYGEVIDMGQEAYLMPEDVEDTVDDHKYVVKEGDCLWNIARRFYGDSAWYGMLYRVNWDVIGRDEDLILPGTRLFLPEAGSKENTRFASDNE